MNRLRLFSLGWWIAHVLAVAFFFWLGHVVHFQ